MEPVYELLSNKIVVIPQKSMNLFIPYVFLPCAIAHDDGLRKNHLHDYKRILIIEK